MNTHDIEKMIPAYLQARYGAGPEDRTPDCPSVEELVAMRDAYRRGEEVERAEEIGEQAWSQAVLAIDMARRDPSLRELVRYAQGEGFLRGAILAHEAHTKGFTDLVDLVAEALLEAPASGSHPFLSIVEGVAVDTLIAALRAAEVVEKEEVTRLFGLGATAPRLAAASAGAAAKVDSPDFTAPRRKRSAKIGPDGELGCEATADGKLRLMVELPEDSPVGKGEHAVRILVLQGRTWAAEQHRITVRPNLGRLLGVITLDAQALSPAINSMIAGEAADVLFAFATPKAS